MINRNLGTAAVLLALFGLAFGLVGCGADTTTEQASNPSGDDFVADANSFDDLSKLATKLGIEIEELSEPEVHRGGGNEIATVYWPQRDVTMDGLQTFRVDVGVEYEDNGRLEFRKGRKVLYSEPFQPEGSTTVAAIPQSVLDDVKAGSTIEWGVFFEGRDKKNSVSGKFKIVRNTKLNRRLSKLESSKYFLRQDAMTREMMKTQVFQNTKLYSEALVQYLGILNYWPDVITPYKGIVETCRRLDLTETPLYTIAAEHVRGQGNLSRPGIRNTQSPARSASNPIASITMPRIPETTAPPLVQRTSEGPKPLGTNLGVAPPKGDFSQPEAGAQATQPGAAGATPPGLEVLARQLQERASQAQQIADSLNKRIDEFESANEHYENVQQSVSDLENRVTDAQSAVEAAQNAVEATTEGSPEREAAEQALNQASQEFQQLQSEQVDAQNALNDASHQRAQAHEALGMGVDAARQQAEQANALADDARREAELIGRSYEAHLGGEETLAPHQIENLQRQALQETQRFDAKLALREAEANANRATQEVATAESNLAAIRAEIDAVLTGGGEPTSEQSLLLGQYEEELLHAEEGLHAVEQEIQAAWAQLRELGIEDPDLPEDAPGGG